MSFTFVSLPLTCIYILQLKFISESHFQDIIEERAISMNCGYPLCQKKLQNIPSQQYHISTKKNKVYDITERKVTNFKHYNLVQNIELLQNLHNLNISNLIIVLPLKTAVS
jgi:hypothetical protein